MSAVMRFVYRSWARLKGLLEWSNNDDELAREIEAHLQMATDENLRRGMSHADARRTALIESGGIENAKEAYRHQRTIPRIDSVFRNFGFAWRGLKRNRAYSIPVIVSLALGIGLNTTIFAMIEQVLLRPLPFANASQLITVGVIRKSAEVAGRSDNFDWVTYGNDLEIWGNGTRTLENVAAFTSIRRVVEGDAGASYVAGGVVTPNLLRVLGSQPLQGRWFTTADRGIPVVAISPKLWRTQFASDPDVLGRTLRIFGKPHTIIGVVADDAALPLDAEYWVSEPQFFARLVARSRDGVSLQMITDDLSATSVSMRNLRKSAISDELRAKSLHEQLFGSARPALALLTGAAVLLFLIACANVTNLSLARALERRREMAMRVALGAGRSSIVALILAEHFVLAFAGGVLGLGLAYVAAKGLVGIMAFDVVQTRDVRLTATAASVAGLLAAIAAILVSVAPALAVTSSRSQPILPQATASASRGIGFRQVRRTLVTVQLTLAMLLLTGTGLLIRSAASLASSDHLGFTPTDVVLVNFQMFGNRYHDEASRASFIRLVKERVSAMPGVQQVAVGPPPLVAGLKEGVNEGFNTLYSYTDSNRANTPKASVWVKHIDESYLQTFNIAVRLGRGFRANDNAAGAPVVILNSTAARLFFGDRNPIGLPLPRRAFFDREHAAPTVVGVVDDALQRDVTEASNPEVFLPVAQREIALDVALSVRSTAPISGSIPAIRRVLKELDPALAATRLEPMGAVVNASMARHKFLLWLVGAFAALALVLSTVGLYAIVSYLVSQRTMEIGLRMALGAQRRQVFGLVIGEGAVLVTTGICVGVVASLMIGQLLRGVLYGVGARDSLTLVCVSTVLAVVGLAAAYIPAHRASRVDPTTALRAD